MSSFGNLLVTVVAAFAIGCGGSAAGGGDGLDGGGSGGGSGSGDGDGDGGSGSSGGENTPPFPECAGGEASEDGFDGDVVCLDGEGWTEVDSGPLAVFEHEFVTWEGIPAVHIRLTFNPHFVDNTYGENAVNWKGVGHTFDSLVGSDHAQIIILDSTGETAFDFKVDYIEADGDASCGYASGGVSGGDGEVLVGDESAILHWTTSLDQNINDRGYCDYTVDSPATDEDCTPDPDAPDWDYRVSYEVWIALSAFDPNAFGSAHLDVVHASPAKADEDTIYVEPVECPDDFCNDPDGCDNGPGDSCENNAECSDNEFCHDGTCLPVID